MEGNMQEYLTEKEAREKRLVVYTEKIQETVLNKSAETIRLLVEERQGRKRISFSGRLMNGWVSVVISM